MRRWFFFLWLCGALSFCCGAREPEVMSLFNGKSLKGWRGSNAWWSVRDHAITGEIPAGQKLTHNEFLWCEAAELRDFVLEFDYRIEGAPSANSGAQFRSRPHGGGATGGRLTAGSCAAQPVSFSATA